MPYLTNADFSLHIMDINMQQIINGNEELRNQANLLALAEARSYLVQKYDVDKELAKTGADRDQQFLSTVIDIAIFHLHKRISPRNIPQLRETAYNNAIAWLKMCAYGDLNPALEKIVPLQGQRVRYGGQPKNRNTY